MASTIVQPQAKDTAPTPSPLTVELEKALGFKLPEPNPVTPEMAAEGCAAVSALLGPSQPVVSAQFGIPVSSENASTKGPEVTPKNVGEFVDQGLRALRLAA